MRLDSRWLLTIGLVISIAAMARAAGAQEFRGRINGTVTDNTGGVLPGVTATATSPALIQPQVQVTRADGVYRFIALPAGLYTLTFQLTGFTTVKREGIRVFINQTLTVDAELPVATVSDPPHATQHFAAARCRQLFASCHARDRSRSRLLFPRGTKSK